MLRTGASRLALRAFPAPAVRPATFRFTAPASQWTTQFSSVAAKRPQIQALVQLKPIQSAVMRRALSQERKEAEARYAQEKLKPTPETVSATSSIHPVRPSPVALQMGAFCPGLIHTFGCALLTLHPLI